MLDGWEELGPELLDRRDAALGAGDLRRFYEGRPPTWAVALAPSHQVPRRGVVGDAVAVVTGAVSPAMVLLFGAGASGRSTAVRQIAVDVASVGRRVLFRRPSGPCDPDAVGALPGGPWVLVSDDADEIAREVERAAELVAAGGRQDVHWVLAAREVDWEARFRPAGGGRVVEPSWERSAAVWPPRSSRGEAMELTGDDAGMVVAAWDVAGWLGALEVVPPEERAAAVVQAGSPLGGWLGPRLGADGLQSHVESALEDLGGGPLRDAFCYAAAAESVGIDGVDLRVLGTLTGVGGADLRDGLAARGLASGTGDALRTRHPAIARTAVGMMAAGGVGGVAGELEDVFRALVRATGETSRTVRPLVSDGPIMTCGPLLSERLQHAGVATGRADRIACAAADEAALVLDELLVMTVHRARTHRQAGGAETALGVLRASVGKTAEAADDWGSSGRAFLCEMSACEASAGRVKDSVVVAGLALADVVGWFPLSMTDARPALACLGTACVQLEAELPSHEELRRLLRATSYLGRRVTPNWDHRTKTEFRRYGTLADDLGVPECSSAEACQWVANAVGALFGETASADVQALPGWLLPDGALTFGGLQRLAGH